MRDGKGNKLTAEEEALVKSIEVTPGSDSLKKVSIDPKPDPVQDRDRRTETGTPHTETAPKF
ncbi:hypothetical protein [Bosea sp. Tri-44]|uniref:hypothetical protein n=1 Tax=Bosea sp. Tri-44 TaxID=1972137 RepID=UPI00100E0E01|nr:hypothetical protein [Bosea sp. Tri-44]